MCPASLKPTLSYVYICIIFILIGAAVIIALKLYIKSKSNSVVEIEKALKAKLEPLNRRFWVDGWEKPQLSSGHVTVGNSLTDTPLSIHDHGHIFFSISHASRTHFLFLCISFVFVWFSPRIRPKQVMFWPQNNYAIFSRTVLLLPVYAVTNNRVYNRRPPSYNTCRPVSTTGISNNTVCSYSNTLYYSRE